MKASELIKELQNLVSLYGDDHYVLMEQDIGCFSYLVPVSKVEYDRLTECFIIRMDDI